MQIVSLDYSSFLGRIAIGKVVRGSIKEGQWIGLAQEGDKIVKGKVKELYVFEGLGKKKVSEVQAGDICAVVGFDAFQIGDSFVDLENPEPLPRTSIDEPTLNMTFSINNSPFFGKDGKYVTSNHLRERLEKLEKNLALRVQQTGDANTFLVFGRGILHLSVLIETMRREGYEMTIGQLRLSLEKLMVYNVSLMNL